MKTCNRSGAKDDPSINGALAAALRIKMDARNVAASSIPMIDDFAPRMGREGVEV